MYFYDEIPETLLLEFYYIRFNTKRGTFLWYFYERIIANQIHPPIYGAINQVADVNGILHYKKTIVHFNTSPDIPFDKMEEKLHLYLTFS